MLFDDFELNFEEYDRNKTKLLSLSCAIDCDGDEFELKLTIMCDKSLNDKMIKIKGENYYYIYTS